jgi:hypothetical protein
MAIGEVAGAHRLERLLCARGPLRAGHFDQASA